MENVQNTQGVNANYQAQPGFQASSPVYDNKERDVQDGSKKSMSALQWAGIIAAGALAVGGTVYAIHKHKQAKLPKLEQVFVNKEGKILEKAEDGAEKMWKAGDTVFKFDGKGKAILQNGEAVKGKLAFNRVVEKEKEGGEKIVKNTYLKYKDGVLQSSIQSGKNGFRKYYNKEGKLAQGVIFDKFKNKAGEEIYKAKHVQNSYDDKGNLTKIITNGKESTVFEYGGENGSEVIKTTKNYYKKGKLSEQISLDKEGNIEELVVNDNKTYLYDKTGKYLGEKQPDTPKAPESAAAQA